MKDIKGVNRGKCLKCDECDEFIEKARCDYCDCVATKHERNDEPDHKKNRLTNVQEDETYLGGSDDIKTNEDSLPVVAITSLSPSGDTSSFTCQDEPMDEPNTNSDVSETEMPISKLDENSLATSLNYEDDHDSQSGSQYLFDVTHEESSALQDSLVSLVDQFENEDTQETNRSTVRTDPTVMVPGHGLQYKSTIVKLLNEDPNLSKDRLVRVRQIQDPYNSNHVLNQTPRNVEDGLSLFDDYAFLDKLEKTFKVGRIQRMRRTINRRTIEYKETVLFSEDYLKDISIIFVQYNSKETNFTLENYKIVTIKAVDVICVLNLNYHPEENSFSIADEERTIISEFIRKTFQTPHQRNLNRNIVSSAALDDDFDGRFCETVLPTETQTGRRTSSRIRKQIHFLS